MVSIKSQSVCPLQAFPAQSSVQGKTLQIITETINYCRNKFYDTGPRGQLYEHICRQSRTTFAQIIFDTFYGSSIWQKVYQNTVLRTKEFQYKHLSCRIFDSFDSFGNPAFSNQSFCSTHPTLTLTTWSYKPSWLPPLYYFRIC